MIIVYKDKNIISFRNAVDDVCMVKCFRYEVRNDRYNIVEFLYDIDIWEDDRRHLGKNDDTELIDSFWDFMCICDGVDVLVDKNDVPFYFQVDEKPHRGYDKWVKHFQRLGFKSDDDTVIKVYRGYNCHEGEKGLSWTTNREQTICWGGFETEMDISLADERVLWTYEDSQSENEIVIDSRREA